MVQSKKARKSGAPKVLVGWRVVRLKLEVVRRVPTRVEAIRRAYESRAGMSAVTYAMLCEVASVSPQDQEVCIEGWSVQPIMEARHG